MNYILYTYTTEARQNYAKILQKSFVNYNIKNYYNKNNGISCLIHFMLNDNKHTIAFDHIESYITKDGKHVLVNSPYHISQENIDYLESEGWIQIYKLYEIILLK